MFALGETSIASAATATTTTTTTTAKTTCQSQIGQHHLGWSDKRWNKQEGRDNVSFRNQTNQKSLLVRISISTFSQTIKYENHLFVWHLLRCVFNENCY